MNPLELVPGATLLAFFIVMIGIVTSSVIVGLLGILAFVVIFYYTRGPTTAGNPIAVSDTLLCPCDGIITSMFCDIQRNTHITIKNDMMRDRRGLYSVLAGTIKLIEKGTGHANFYIETPVGHVIYRVTCDFCEKLKVFANVGAEIQKGERVCFIPTSAEIEVTLPVYQSSFVVERHTRIRAGDPLGDANQVWSL